MGTTQPYWFHKIFTQISVTHSVLSYPKFHISTLLLIKMATIVDFSAFLRHQLKLTVALKELNFKVMLVILHTCIAWSIYTLFLGKMLQVYSPLAKNNYNIFMVWELSFWNQFFYISIYREYYMAKSVSHPTSTRDSNLILVEDWYGVWYKFCHVLLFLLYFWILNKNCIKICFINNFYTFKINQRRNNTIFYILRLSLN